VANLSPALDNITVKSVITNFTDYIKSEDMNVKLISLPETANIKLMVLDMTGKTIRTLVDVQQEAGEQSVEFNATGLSPGIYFCRFVTAESIENQNLVLIN